jgi:hypothetical protein
MRRSNARRVVHAIADHRDLLAALREAVDDRKLFVGFELGADIVEPEVASQLICRGLSVAREHERRESSSFQ